jgi:hypothetical protein
LSEVGAEPGRYVGADAAVLAPVGLDSAAAREHDFEQSVGLAQVVAGVVVAAADPGGRGVHEPVEEVALATAALETASTAFDFASTDELVMAEQGERQPVDAAAYVAARTWGDHLA